MKLLTEKNLMWLAIAALAVLQFCPNLLGGDKHSQRAMRARMGQMQERMGSKWDGMPDGERGQRGPRAEGKKKQKPQK